MKTPGGGVLVSDEESWAPGLNLVCLAVSQRGEPRMLFLTCLSDVHEAGLQATPRATLRRTVPSECPVVRNNYVHLHTDRS